MGAAVLEWLHAHFPSPDVGAAKNIMYTFYHSLPAAGTADNLQEYTYGECYQAIYQTENFFVLVFYMHNSNSELQSIFSFLTNRSELFPEFQSPSTPCSKTG